MTFNDLALCDGPGMGLVVYWTDLLRLLWRCLAGRDASKQPDIRRFRASVVRMQSTVAVSYRWQSEERTIGQTTHVNMSDFQMKALVRFLSPFPHLYVWLDILSVDQEPGLLQSTLLTRMMGVYCAADMVIGLRSQEPDLSRYHQRAWTLQPDPNGGRRVSGPS